MRLLRAPGWLAIAVWLAAATPATAADSIGWNRREGRVDADVRSWPLSRTLQAIRSATGWQIYVEPDTEHATTVQFRGLEPAEALRRLLGDLNFALLPQVDGPSKLFVYRHSVGAATQAVAATPRRKPTPIRNELLVTVKPSGHLPPALEGRVVARLDAAGAYRLRFDDERAARKARADLEHDGDVASIETNVEIAPPAVLEPLSMSSPAPLGLVPDVSPSSDKVVIGLVDGAVQRDAPMLGGFLQPSIELVGDWQPPAGEITHGTAMAQTILDGVALALEGQPNASRAVPISILPIDVYAGSETTNSFDVARGIYEALTNHANVVNLSLAGDSDSALIGQMIGLATDHGVLVLAAAGNTPGTAPMYPAADPGVIAVTAADANGGVASWADHGAFVNAMAPGMNVVYLGDTAWLGTGTSFSTGRVSGWAAGFMATAGPTSAAARQQTLMRWALP
jgi:hypothetical protein